MFSFQGTLLRTSIICSPSILLIYVGRVSLHSGPVSSTTSICPCFINCRNLKRFVGLVEHAFHQNTSMQELIMICPKHAGTLAEHRFVGVSSRFVGVSMSQACRNLKRFSRAQVCGHVNRFVGVSCRLVGVSVLLGISTDLCP